MNVEKSYIESIDGILAKKAALLEEIPNNLNQYEVTKQYKHVLDELSMINEELGTGVSIVVALIYKEKLYVANIGNCKALLCKNDDNNVLRVTQLSVDHDLLTNPDEEQRFKNLGLDVTTLKKSGRLTTRCIGNFMGKTGYKDSSMLSVASEAPILATPDIVGPIEIDSSCRFMLLMSRGLCKTLSDIFEFDATLINKEIVQMAVEQFRVQTNLMNVSQSVVNKILLQHHDTFMSRVDEEKSLRFSLREDITLIIRNFNYPLPNAPQKKGSVHSHSRSASDTTDTIVSENFYTGSTTNSLSENHMENGRYMSLKTKTKPYVDFEDYYRRVEDAKLNGTLPGGIEFD